MVLLKNTSILIWDVIQNCSFALDMKEATCKGFPSKDAIALIEPTKFLMLGFTKRCHEVGRLHIKNAQ